MSDVKVAQAALLEHLATKSTTVCQCWLVTRRDGVSLGFTDHDRELSFDGASFRPETGLTASVLSQTTGLSVDNREVLGALTDAAITETDVRAGRFDGARVVSWLVNWADVTSRMVQFRGELGEIREEAGQFRAELRGLTEALNQPQGMAYQKLCSAVLGDQRCGVDLTTPGLHADLSVEDVRAARVFRFSGLGGFAPGWFSRGRLRMLTGAAEGLVGLIKADREVEGLREIEVWESFRADVHVGDSLRLEAGCDRTVATCRDKYANFLNFRGFPHIPGDDWLTSYPTAGTEVAPSRAQQALGGAS